GVPGARHRPRAQRHARGGRAVRSASTGRARRGGQRAANRDLAGRRCRLALRARGLEVPEPTLALLSRRLPGPARRVCRGLAMSLGRAGRPRAGVSFASMEILRITILFAITALAEIVGCYLPWLVLRQGRSAWLLIPAALSLAFFAWLLTLHPAAAGRTYAAYGGMYIAVALLWLHFVDGLILTRWDALGAAFTLIGMAIIA